MRIGLLQADAEVTVDVEARAADPIREQMPEVRGTPIADIESGAIRKTAAGLVIHTAHLIPRWHLHTREAARLQDATNLGHRASGIEPREVLQDAIGKHGVERSRRKRQMSRVANDERRGHVQLLRDPARSHDRAKRRIDPDWYVATFRGGNAPPAPAAADIQ